MLSSVRQALTSIASVFHPLLRRSSSDPRGTLAKDQDTSTTSWSSASESITKPKRRLLPLRTITTSFPMRRTKKGTTFSEVPSVMTSRRQSLTDDEAKADLLQGLEGISDAMTGQDPNSISPIVPVYRDMKMTDDRDKTARIAFSNYILQDQDGLDPRIIESLDLMNKLQNNPIPSIRQQYTKLHSLIKEDFWQVSKMLSSSSLISYSSLKLNIEIAIQSYQIALDIGTKLSDISAMRDDMVSRSKEYREQEKNAREFQEDMVTTWGRLAKTMTSYNEMIEKKILDSSTPRTSGRGYLNKMPTNTASSSTSRVQAVSLVMSPGNIYKSKVGVLKVISSRQIHLDLSSAEYRPLSRLNEIDVGPNAWEQLLNRDMIELTTLLSYEATCLDDLKSLNEENKAKCFNKLISRVPMKTGQWILVEN